jgi:mycothiol synthase
MDLAGSATNLRTRPLIYVDGVVDQGDLATATRLVLGCEEAVIGRPDSSSDNLVRKLSVSSMDRDNSCFFLDGDDVVGLLWIEKDPYEMVTGVDAYTLPWPGTREVRIEALRRGLKVARRHRQESGSSKWKARSGGYVADEAYASVMTELGMTPVRRFYRMQIESTSPLVPDKPPTLPPGVEIVPGAADDETRRIVYRIQRDAFCDHYGWADYPYDDWWEHMSASPSFNPDDWWLVTVEGEPAAICLLGEGRAQHNEGYVMVLGVLKAFRGRGLAQLALQRAFVHYRDLGRHATLLGVDATNTTGAVALYEKVGMAPVMIMEAYEHALS